MPTLEELERRITDLEAAQANTRTDTLITVDSTGRVLQQQFNVNLVTLFNGTLSYTPTTGTKSLIVECIGAGGGGGGSAANGPATVAVAGGGGGGGAAIKYIASPILPPYSVSIGAFGGGGGAGANPGGTGGDTNFSGVCIAKAGQGGAAGAALAPPIIPSGVGEGGRSDTGVGDVVLGGGPAIPGYTMAQTSLQQGSTGGNSARGGGARIATASANGTSQIGQSGWNYGSGGGGAHGGFSAIARAGGNGAPGVIFITEIIQVLA